MNGCAFMRHVRDDAATLSYGEWHAGLTIVARCEDGERHAHELSAPYPGYDRDETQGQVRRCPRGQQAVPLRDDRHPLRGGSGSVRHMPVPGDDQHPGSARAAKNSPDPTHGDGASPGDRLARPERPCQRPARHWRGDRRDPTDRGAVAEQRCNLTDLGNAERLVDAHGKSLRYSHVLKRWFAWDGKHWAEDDSGAVMRHAKATARAIYGEAERAAIPDHAKALAKHAMSSQSAERLKAMVELARSEPGIPISPNDLDQDPWLLNVANGILDLRSGELQPHRREAYPEQARAGCLRPERALRHVPRLSRSHHGRRPGADRLPAVRRRLFFDRRHLRAGRVHPAWHWPQRQDDLRGSAPLPRSATTTPPAPPTDTLLARRFEQIPNDLAALRGKRFVSASEVNQGRRLDEAKIKDITGGDTITARFMRGEWFDYQPQFKLWLSTNHKPVIRGTDEGIWDRIRLAPFDVRIPEDEIDRRLGQKLREEAPGILAWMVDGCLQWQERGLDPPDESLDRDPDVPHRNGPLRRVPDRGVPAQRARQGEGKRPLHDLLRLGQSERRRTDHQERLWSAGGRARVHAEAGNRRRALVAGYRHSRGRSPGIGPLGVTE